MKLEEDGGLLLHNFYSVKIEASIVGILKL